VKLVAKSDLGASARLNQERSRVVIRLGPLTFVAARAEAIQLAAQLVAAVDELDTARATDDG